MREDEDEDGAPPRPGGMAERLRLARRWFHPTSYAPVLPRLTRGEPALATERRARPRVAGSPRGVLVDLVG